MRENEYRDNIDNQPEDQAAETETQPMVQDGAYGWQSEIVPRQEARRSEEPRQESQGNQSRTEYTGYAYTGAYAETSSKELSRAAKEAKKHEKQQKKAVKHQGQKRRSLGNRIAALLLCGVLFGGATAGTFIGVLHLTGYHSKLEQAVNAAEEAKQAAQKAQNAANTAGNSSIQTGATLNPTISESDSDVSAVYNAALPSVVAITNKAVYEYNYGFQIFDREVEGSGSGIIIGKNDTELLIVTNYHVIEGADEITVTFVDGKTVEAYTKGTAQENDLAVVAVMLADMEKDTKSAISIATLATEEAEVGQKVEAIGNALGYGQTMTVGYISAVNREVTIENVTMTLLQTDAAINPGNSGGALLNMKGEVIGINSAKYSDTNVEGMGFAIPVSLVREIIEELMNKETMVKVSEEEMGYMGVSMLNVASNNAYGIPVGALVKEIVENSPAADSELKNGDIIVGFDGTEINSKEDLSNLMSYYKGGTTVTLTVQRLLDGRYQEIEIELTLGFKKDYVQE